MWKKVLWVYLAIYSLAILYVLFSNIIKDAQNGDFNLAGSIFVLFMFIPALAVVLGLKGKKEHILLVLLGLLIVAVPVAGIFNFNEMSFETIGKALFFAPMIIGLIYYGFKGLFGKNNSPSLES